jgi:hypothetical protein
MLYRLIELNKHLTSCFAESGIDMKDIHEFQSRLKTAMPPI